MVEVANFKVQQLGGADVATILDNEYEMLEILRRQDGTFDLIVHNRRGETDRWDDLSVNLKPQHFAVLGTIADMAVPQSSLKDRVMAGFDSAIDALKNA